jgi:hypothetical protein
MFADNWCIKSNERIYGPYSSADLRKFAHEGRFAAWSLVAPAGSGDFKEACAEPTFASFFGGVAAEPAAPSRAFGKLDSPANDQEAAARAPRRARSLGGQETKKTPPTDRAGPANFVIVFDVVNAGASRVENALVSLGAAFRLAENVWAVNCTLTAIGLRNALAPFLKPHETLFVVDATNGRTSWQNYAPEAHAKITAAFVHKK